MYNNLKERETMLSIIGQIIIGLWFLLYFVFILLTGSIFLKTKMTDNPDIKGKILWWHGAVWAGMLCASTVLGLTYIFIQMMKQFLPGI